MKSFRFAVLGDTHYCTMRGRSPVRPKSGPMPDYFRYTAMTKTVLPRLADKIAQSHADMLFSTGDLIEGMHGSDEQDHIDAVRLFAPCAPRFYLTRGSHDWKVCGAVEYRKIVYENCVFLILDYTDWGETQKRWLSSELAAAKTAKYVFLFAHAPLYLLGRHFFDNEPFRNEVEALLKQFPCDVYFCGHTHNQTASFHNGILQIAGSSQGFPDAPELPLTEIHAIPEALKENYIWGIPEDHAPAFFIVDVSAAGIVLTRHTLNGESGRLAITRRFEAPRKSSLPSYTRQCAPLHEEDMNQIRCGWVNIFSANKAGERGSALLLNGIFLGELPHGVCYEARHFRMLTQEAAASVGQSNKLEIVFPETGPFAVGSLSLTLLLLDGRVIRSSVAPECFVCGRHVDFTFAEPSSICVEPTQKVEVSLVFPPFEPDDSASERHIDITQQPRREREQPL